MVANSNKITGGSTWELRGETAQFLVSVVFPKGVDNDIVKEIIAEYLLLFQEKFKLGNVAKKSRATPIPSFLLDKRKEK